MIPLQVPAKKAKFLDDDSDPEDDFDHGGVKLSINEEFARRFEHNKKRAELERLEEKYGKNSINQGDDVADEDEESSEDETEDDEGEFATEALDQEIAATLNAIRTKDPKVYNKQVKFFSEIEAQPSEGAGNAKTADKPMYLRDYHRQNLLNGGAIEEQDEIPYAQQQRALKKSLVDEMHAAAEEGSDEAQEETENTFLKPVRKVIAPKPELPDLTLAERDPETFLSNFLASRAWVPTEATGFAALESDEEEDDVKADAFEEYYNLRFEDPQLANQKLVSYARDSVAARSVRRETKSSRRKQKDQKIAQKEAERAERDAERAQLRKLKMEQIEEKVKKIREAAGLSGKDFKVEDWTKELEADFDDDQWDVAMRQRFGEDYYAQGDVIGLDEAGEGASSRKPKKPTWDDDMDIKDLVPDFDDEDADIDPELRLTDDEADIAINDIDGTEGVTEPMTEVAAAAASSKKEKKDRKSVKAAEKASRRRDERLIAAIVDQSLPLPIAQPGSKGAGTSSKSSNFAPFRYRETSPNSFGMTHLDILGATDAQLNEYAGLKKLATFRDDDRKARDRKKLGKKQRLRQWRRDTFGNEVGPDAKSIFRVPVTEEGEAAYEARKEIRALNGGVDGGVDIREGGKKRRKKRGTGKSAMMEA